MANPSKKKGSLFEVQVVGFMRGGGFPTVERRAPSGAKDLGDIAGLPGVVIEVKNQKRQALSAWMDAVCGPLVFIP